MAQFVSGSSVAVETFFFISATLLSYKVFKDEECNKSVGSIFLSRYIRITLPHIVVIAFICLLPLFSSGPLYKEIVGSYSENCRNWGWMNLLYINNYGPGQKMCLNVSWYLSVDTQLFLISLFILVAFKRNPKTIFILAITLLFCGFFGTILSHIIFKLPPTTLLLNLHPDYMIHIWQRSLFLPHFHLPTYSIGLLVGYLLTREKQIEVSKGIKSFLWIASLLAQFSIVFGVYIWNKSGEHPGLFSSVLYGSTHRLIWTLTLAWITLACKANDTSLVSSFLGSEFFVPLSRLSFMMYLTHCVIKVYYVGTASALITYSYTTIFLMFFSLIMFTFIISCLLTVIFISPFKRFEDTLMDRWIGKYGTKGH